MGRRRPFLDRGQKTIEGCRLSSFFKTSQARQKFFCSRRGFRGSSDCTRHNNDGTRRECKAVGTHAAEQRTLEGTFDTTCSQNEKVECAAHRLDVVDNKITDVAARVEEN